MVNHLAAGCKPGVSPIPWGFSPHQQAIRLTTNSCPTDRRWAPAYTENPVSNATFGSKLLTREEAGEKVMLQVLDLIEYGRSQTLTAEQLQVIKSFVNEMLEDN
jgi:hypothetical protein